MGILKTKSRVALFPGNPAISLRPVAFRPRLTAGLAFFYWNFYGTHILRVIVKYFLYILKKNQEY
jgi:hypothetical protein